MKNLCFLKCIIVFCISFIVLYTIASMILNYLIGIELNPTLTTAVYAFFGTELAVSALIKVVETMNQKGEE